jgi:hypothetical protein
LAAASAASAAPLRTAMFVTGSVGVVFVMMIAIEVTLLA